MRRVFGASIAAAVIMAAATTEAQQVVPRWDLVIGSPVDVEELLDRRLAYVGLDVFDTPADSVAALRKSGVHVWCYVNAGTIEESRPDLTDFEDAHVAAAAADEPPLIATTTEDGERWLNPRAIDRLMPLVSSRLQICVDKGFDMVAFDNVDGHENDTDFVITKDETIAYAQALAAAARQMGLAPILTSNPELTEILEPWFAAYLMEECLYWGFCEAGNPFTAAGKPVFNIEYPSVYEDEGKEFDISAVCDSEANGAVAMLIKPEGLTMDTKPCP